MTYENLKKLSDDGVSIWLDDLSRDRLLSGGLAGLVKNKYITGVTTNPTIFQKAISGSTTYDAQVKDLAVREVTVEEAVRMITTRDVRDAADVLRPVYDRTGGVDGRVSIEVDPRLAHKTAPTIAEAKQLWWLVDRENVLIKIPATVEGLPAITAVLAEGISVNVTLIFSLERYRAVMDAFIAGIEQAKANGHDVAKIQSVASFFVSRVDTEVDQRLKKLGGEEAGALLGKAAVANARLAYEAFEEVFGGERWAPLKAAGATAQRPLWASTGVKDPAYKDTLYVDDLIVAGTVNTMPEATLNAEADHGAPNGDAVRGHYADAKKVIDGIEALGISYADVVQVLEDEGVDKFEASWTELLGAVQAELDKERAA
jgi:transaldolase